MYRRRRGAPLPDLATLDPKSEKARLRKQMRAARRQLGPQAQAQASNALLSHALATSLFASGHRVAAYWAAGGELSLKPLLALLLARGVFVYLPRVVGDGEMHFFRFHGENFLALSQHGIFSPIVDAAGPITAHDIDVMLLPLLAFDPRGARLGQGGGYYDRYLQGISANKPLRVGVGFHFQALAQVPHATLDERLHAAITDQGVFRF
jgi:5-formyltetrahydrofolate cyclo-ligase